MFLENSELNINAFQFSIFLIKMITAVSKDNFLTDKILTKYANSVIDSVNIGVFPLAFDAVEKLIDAYAFFAFGCQEDK